MVLRDERLQKGQTEETKTLRSANGPIALRPRCSITQGQPRLCATPTRHLSLFALRSDWHAAVGGCERDTMDDGCGGAKATQESASASPPPLSWRLPVAPVRSRAEQSSWLHVDCKQTRTTIDDAECNLLCDSDDQQWSRLAVTAVEGAGFESRATAAAAVATVSLCTHLI